MTKEQMELYMKITAINEEVNRLQKTIILLQTEQDKLSKQLFDTIDKPNVLRKDFENERIKRQ